MRMKVNVNYSWYNKIFNSVIKSYVQYKINIDPA